jgi:probable HAF family extracellular repeat protein
LLESRKTTSFAAALNKHGVIVGWDGRRRPARWVHGERRVLTGVKKGQATGIGDDGTIAGTSLDHEVPRCFSWKDGAAADLGTLGGDHCYVYGIDSTGRYIAGESDFSFAPARYHAFIHDENGMHDLGSLPGEYVSTANAVNRYGHASVTAPYDDSGDQAAVYWDGVRLVQVPGVNAGGNWSIGGAINDRDQMLVAGWDTEGHALFLYDGRSGVVTAIQPLIHNIEGWTFGFDQDLYITGLTNDGRIVGATNYQNELHGFLLVPDSQ